MKRLALAALTAATLHAHAETPPPAYQRAAQFGGIPADLLYAIAKAESNFRIKIGTYPWPWTLNVNGAAKYFRTREEACGAILQGLDEFGPYKVDIGLTQQNWGWVGSKYYRHPCDALAPNDNLHTAAVVIRECYDRERDWILAAGCYHRPAGGEPARKYREGVRTKLDQITAGR
ncbi:transglycosylase SLT domain-containing protein [Metapseudomonas furukawaii]|uniref:transglycosylase SLT domain-containing protein n=1 Tax=Metapseudomonas furukawaii TaxID=1149133 RepID=UPI0002ABA6A9|nr:transglycosylase SLT domain-containing protein [Pseudomonas furukawaii]ELS26290.1 Soluble lytic murein transglycosylase [Pseudomonas furukawaii]